jgi:hypothetical protein
MLHIRSVQRDGEAEWTELPFTSRPRTILFSHLVRGRLVTSNSLQLIALRMSGQMT